MNNNFYYLVKCKGTLIGIFDSLNKAIIYISRLPNDTDVTLIRRTLSLSEVL